jgi:hypothetical protein
LWHTGISCGQRGLLSKVCSTFADNAVPATWCIGLDDLRLLHAAQIEARNAFNTNASLAPNDPATKAAIDHCEQVAKILRENIVQGKAIGDDKYSMYSTFLLLDRH